MVHTVREIMVTEVITLEEADNLLDIEDGMEHLRLRHLPVVDGNKLVGLLTHRDILRLTAGIHSGVDLEKRARDAEGTFVASVMTTDLKTAHPDMPIVEAAQHMLEGHFGCLPVVDEEGDLIGIVTEHDLLKFLVEQLHETEAPQKKAAKKKVPKKKAPKKKATKK